MQFLALLGIAWLGAVPAQEPPPAQTPVIVTAAGAGRTVDRVLRIEDSRDVGLSPPRPMLNYARAAEAPQTPIEPGLIEIRARVTLTSSMK